MPALDKIDQADVLHVRFEDLVTRPRKVISSIADFFGVAGSRWLDEACAVATGLPPTRFESLSGDEQLRLVEACRPGMELLKQ